MRRRLDLEKISVQILVVLHEKFFDDETEFLSFSEIREAIPDEPANAIQLQLNGQIAANNVVQETEERERQFPVPTSYQVSLDGYQITKRGILAINDINDDEYGKIRASLNLNNAVSQDDELNWEPIPLDREDPKQKHVLESLDKVIAELRGDNGYAATNPEEKKFIQDKLLAASDRLKKDTHISWVYLVEFALKPLGLLAKRFGGAAIGVAATAAKEAFSAWLKKKGISFLDDFKWP